MAVTQTDLDNSTLMKINELNANDIKKALLTADGIGHFATLADFKASTKIYENGVHIDGYYSADDGAFGSLNHYLLPNDGTVYTEQGGVQFQTASGRWYKLRYKKLFAEYMGVVGNNESFKSTNTSLINLGLTIDDVYLDNKEYYIDSKLLISNYGLFGKGFYSVIKASSTFPDTEPIVDTEGSDHIKLDNFRCVGTGTNEVNIKISGNGAADGSNRSTIGTLYSEQAKLGFSVDGWVNYIQSLHAVLCDVGHKFNRINGTTIDLLVSENCKKYFEIAPNSLGEGASAININTIVCEGLSVYGTNTISSTIDGVGELTIGAMYLEYSEANSSSKTVIKIGETQQVRNCNINVFSAHEVDTTVSPLGCVIEVFDVDGLNFDGYIKSNNNKDGIYLHKDLAKNIIDKTIQTNGYKTATKQLINYIPNSNLAGGAIIAPTMNVNVNTGESASIVREIDADGEYCLKITAGTDLTKLELMADFHSANTSIVNRLINTRIVGQVDIMNEANVNIGQDLMLQFRKADNSYIATIGSTDNAQSREYGIYQTMQTFVNYLVPNTVGKITFGVRIKCDNVNVISAGESIYLKNFFLGDFTKNRKVQQKDYIQANGIGIDVYCDNLIWNSTPDSSVDSLHRRGDKYLYPDPATSGYIGKVCTADGQAFANWSNYGALV